MALTTFMLLWHDGSVTKSVITFDILLYMDIFNYIYVIIVKDLCCNF